MRSDCEIHPTAIICENVRMGAGNVIGPMCVIGYPGAIRDADAFNGTVVIGEGNTFGVGVTVCIGEEGETLIGDGNIIMNGVNIGHNSKIGSGCEIGARTVIAGWATIEDRVQIKIGSVIRNRIAVGEGALVGMGSNVVRDVIPGTRVKGNPAKAY